jgi:hypothetical protein
LAPLGAFSFTGAGSTKLGRPAIAKELTALIRSARENMNLVAAAAKLHRRESARDQLTVKPQRH